MAVDGDVQPVARDDVPGVARPHLQQREATSVVSSQTQQLHIIPNCLPTLDLRLQSLGRTDSEVFKFQTRGSAKRAVLWHDLIVHLMDDSTACVESAGRSRFLANAAALFAMRTPSMLAIVSGRQGKWWSSPRPCQKSCSGSSVHAPSFPERLHRTYDRPAGSKLRASADAR